MIATSGFIKSFHHLFPKHNNLLPWDITSNITEIITALIAGLNDEYNIDSGIAIHKTAVVEAGAIIKGPVIIGANCMVASNTYLRGGVYFAEDVKVGTGVEIKSSVIFSSRAIAHFNFIGDSIIGSHVNFEAGAITANHYNERENKNIYVMHNSTTIDTGTSKFGALVGDHCKIGANAVLSPGTILPPGTIIKRLQLIDQLNQSAIDERMKK